MAHTHKPHCLLEDSGCRVDYALWVALASRRVDQNHTWREHERLGSGYERERRDLMPEYYEIGGEA